MKKESNIDNIVKVYFFIIVKFLKYFFKSIMVEDNSQIWAMYIKMSLAWNPSIFNILSEPNQAIICTSIQNVWMCFVDKEKLHIDIESYE